MNTTSATLVIAAMTPWPLSILFLALVACPAVAHHDTPFDYDPLTPLRLESTLVRHDGAIDVHTISFDSPRGGRVTGKLFVPTAPRSTRPRVPRR